MTAPNPFQRLIEHVTTLNPPAVQNALRVLAEAHGLSGTERDRWQFALDWVDLEAVGLRAAELRFLIREGLILHATETTGTKAKRRTFRSIDSLSFPAGTCVRLTPLGVAVAEAVAAAAGESKLGGRTTAPVLHPTWDGDMRVLRWGEVLLKAFRQPAANQELILDAFEEQGWPERIDDPLPPERGMEAHQRLRDTVKNLNRSHRVPLIRFWTDGTGEGICWTLVGLTATPERPRSKH
jgi:hypothetical protein